MTNMSSSTSTSKNTSGRGVANVRRGGRGNRSQATTSTFRTDKRGAKADFCTSRGTVNMSHIPSISRSSGLDKDGDTLKSTSVQEQYRQFIQEKIDDYWSKYHRGHPVSDVENKQKPEMETSLMILLRKLREGVTSLDRRDHFSLEVFETSLYLAVMFGDHTRTNSITSQLTSVLQKYPPPKSGYDMLILVVLLESLKVAHPSQRLYQEHLRSIPSQIRLGNDLDTWIQSVARCLRRQEFRKLDELTNSTIIDTRLLSTGTIQSKEAADEPPSPSPRPSTSPSMRDLQRLALRKSLLELREKTRIVSWKVIRAAYREFRFSVLDTRPWLQANLLLAIDRAADDAEPVDTWFMERQQQGEVEKREGVGSQWVIKLKR